MRAMACNSTPISLLESTWMRWVRSPPAMRSACEPATRRGRSTMRFRKAYVRKAVLHAAHGLQSHTDRIARIDVDAQGEVATGDAVGVRACHQQGPKHHAIQEGIGEEGEQETSQHAHRHQLDNPRVLVDFTLV